MQHIFCVPLFCRNKNLDRISSDKLGLDLSIRVLDTFMIYMRHNILISGNPIPPTDAR